jgi:VWFA-related protein
MLFRRRSILPALTLALVISLSCHAFAQDDGDGDGSGPVVQHGQGALNPAVPSLVPAAPTPASRTIHLDVVVTPGPAGAPVGGLLQNDFVIRDNNAIQSIQSFRAVRGPAAKAEVVLVIDAVNAVYQRMPYERQQAAAFLRGNGGKLDHPTAIAIFTDAGLQMQPAFSTDGNALADFVEHVTIPIRSIGTSAGYYGADERFQKSIRGFSALITRLDAEPGRKLVVWISPGWPFLSGPRTSLDKRSQQNIFDTVVALSTRLRNAAITVYSINPAFPGNAGRIFYYQQFLKPVEKPGKVQIGNLGVQVLAAQTGGLVLNSSNDIAASMKTAVDDAGSYYELTYDPSPAAAGGEYHRIEVTLTRPGLTARTRHGYYSQP